MAEFGRTLTVLGYIDMIRTFDRVLCPGFFALTKLHGAGVNTTGGSQIDGSEGETGFWDTRAENFGSIWSRATKATRLS